MMKTTKKLIMIFAPLLCLAACSKAPDVPPGEKDYMELSISSIEIDGAKGTFTFDVESNTDWTIGSNAEWLDVLNHNGRGSAKILCSYEQNNETTTRYAKITVTSQPSTHTIVVAQKPSDSGSEDGGNDGSDGGNDDGNDDGNDGGDDGDGDGNDDGGDDDGDGGDQVESSTPHAGWAELPAEEQNSDYYYAYHLRADNSAQRNLSICYSASKACPVWVAAPLHSCYKGSAGRSGYSPDPQVPSHIQATPAAGDTNKGNWVNRGHMLASNKRTVSSATNSQVFYYTNIAPQNGSTLNTGGGLWNNLEDYEDDIMCADTLYTVHGCHWTNSNETFNGQVVPTHFYKVYLRTKRGNSGKWVKECAASELQCVAFYMSHDVEKCQPSQRFMMSVAELEEITGHTFFPNVPNAPKESFSPSDWGM